MVLKFSLQTLQNAPRVGLQTAYIVVLARLSDNGHSKIRDHVIKSSDVTRVGTNKWVIACMWVRSVTALGLTAECTGNLTINQLAWRWTECIYHLIRIHSGSYTIVQCSAATVVRRNYPNTWMHCIVRGTYTMSILKHDLNIGWLEWINMIWPQPLHACTRDIKVIRLQKVRRRAAAIAL